MPANAVNCIKVRKHCLLGAPPADVWMDMHM